MAETNKVDPPLPRFRIAPEANRTLPVLQDDGTDCVVALRALGEDTRLRIIGLLLKGPLEVGEIANRLDISQYNVSKHLRILREAGLLILNKDGRIHRYALPDDTCRQIADGGVLDLGCCTFKFEAAPPSSSPRRQRTRTATT